MLVRTFKSALPKGRAIIGLVVATLMVVALGLVGAGSANASEGGCTGPIAGWLQQDICVVIETGTKDHTNHRQWLSWAQANEPHPAPDEFLELWGDDFYYSGYGTVLHKDINKWVRSGTNVCAAETDHEGVRQIACLHITA